MEPAAPVWKDIIAGLLASHRIRLWKAADFFQFPGCRGNSGPVAVVDSVDGGDFDGASTLAAIPSLKRRGGAKRRGGQSGHCSKMTTPSAPSAATPPFQGGEPFVRLAQVFSEPTFALCPFS